MKKITLAATTAVVLTAAVAVLYGSFPALAQSGPDPMGKAAVTWAEAKTSADAMWTKFDLNKDGMINEADRTAKMTQMFDTIDANRDGAVSRAEFTDHHKAMMEGKGKDGAEGGGPGKDMGMGVGHGGRMLHKMAEMADTNHDKSISRAEFDAAAKARFDKADADHDGKLTAAERRTAWGAMRKKHGWGGGRGRGHGHGMHDGMGGDMPPPPPGA